ncbi:cytochrome C biogenesis protein CcdA [Weizmannia acidilactici]|uniref:Cytochrome C biogenesis protein CcdA n=1 Tax=Weizmannia acidilactici TaxID=2607726 RepID=A0A5J4JRN1_9BACI|nr:cytochrome c biogenesis protein CcdA [Weizmannia acidilactici]GER68590.1 cytochrome C biogenesis protein CcdA [Weizmannia acidilactici]GER71764.1 cytochrome C biogenesis protein CcdA [Weizmannia acidilactici]GER73701.1 cytochrome C biogenesis protein CcdA [Weizmannia acidilactici]
MADITVWLSFGAGFMSFISPCCLPLYPAFVSYITGASVGQLKAGHAMRKWRSIAHTACFLAGFSVVFIALGFGASWIGNMFITYGDLIRQLGAIFLIFFGLVAAGVFQPRIFMKAYRFDIKKRPLGLAGSFLVGLVFAAGWTPCTGPILASVLALAVANPASASVYMAAYVFGFSIPFLILAFFIGRLGWMQKYSAKLVKISGFVMAAAGILLFFDWMAVISGYISALFGGFQGF